MKLRPETESDYAAIATVVTQAFGQANEAQLIDRIRSSDRYCPSLAIVAELEGAIVGHILFSYVDLVSEESRSILSLAPVAVQPALQKQGIGSALVQAGLTVADSLGEALIVVLGHPQFYPRFGFKPSVEYAIESPFPVPDAAFMVKPLQHFHTAYRGRVVYPPAFNNV